MTGRSLVPRPCMVDRPLGRVLGEKVKNANRKFQMEGGLFFYESQP